MSDFNRIVWCYDRLKKLVFGDLLDQAINHFLHTIAEGSNILILGGGTGELLKKLPAGVNTIFLDKSAGMIAKARSKGVQEVRFVTMDFLDFETDDSFDYIICPFFLDLFDKEQLDLVVKKIAGFLKSNGKLMVTDFQVSRRIHRLLIWMMIWFFKITARLRTDQLLPIDQFLGNSGFHTLKSEQFKNGLIFSHIYQKPHK